MEGGENLGDVLVTDKSVTRMAIYTKRLDQMLQVISGAQKKVADGKESLVWGDKAKTSLHDIYQSIGTITEAVKDASAAITSAIATGGVASSGMNKELDTAAGKLNSIMETLKKNTLTNVQVRNMQNFAEATSKAGDAAKDAIDSFMSLTTNAKKAATSSKEMIDSSKSMTDILAKLAEASQKTGEVVA